MNEIKHAIVPIAGLGTRLYPITKDISKELIPINGKPLLYYGLKELIESGIETISLVCGNHNADIVEKYLHDSFIPDYDIDYRIIKQPNPDGLGDAILRGGQFIKEGYFVILFPDDLFISDYPITNKLIEIADRSNHSVICSRFIPMEQSYLYGVIKGSVITDNIAEIDAIVEKPSDVNISPLVVTGRYILNESILDKLFELRQRILGELDFTQALNAYLNKNKTYAYVYRDLHYDCGSKEGLFMAMKDGIGKKKHARELQ